VWVRPSDYKVVGKCLATARMRAGMSQQELSRKLRKPQSFISSYERGQRRVDVVEFLLIAEAIGDDARKLFREIYANQEARAAWATGSPKEWDLNGDVPALSSNSSEHAAMPDHRC
jgi:transcriptional regulator with XRE-family HTH domain